MNLKTKNLLCLLSMLWLAQFSLHAQATKEVVEITVPGTLEEVINNLESSRFESLTIKGGLNAVDFAYLNSGKDKVAMIETLDLSEVTLVPGDEPYNTILVGRDAGAFGYFYNIYYISDTYKVYEESQSSGLGGSNRYTHIFCNDLSGVFYKNEAFEKIILPKTLPNVGEYMFSNNSSTNSILKEIVLPTHANTIGKGAFSDCRVLEKVELPKKLSAIEANSFYHTAIKELTLPTTTVRIGDGAFAESEITLINLGNVEEIGAGAFSSARNLVGELNINKVDTIKSNSFSGTGISSIKFSPTLKIIGDNAFEGYNGVELTFPENLEQIGKYAFSRSLNITELELPKNLERIGDRAFYECRNLEEVTIPASILQIGNSAFEGTPWLKTIGSENGVRYIANVAYDFDSSYQLESDTFKFLDGTIAISDGFSFPSAVKEKVKSLQLPESLIEIGNNVFSQFKVLGEVKLPSSLKRIGQQAFAECPKFWCTLPESLETLEYKAFYGCTTLSQATLPENLHYIGGEVFRESAVGTVYVNSRDLHYQFLDWEMGSTKPIFGEYSSLKKAIIGPNVTRLYDGMFGMTSSLISVEFLDPERSQLTYIGENCFYGCAAYMTDNHLTIKNLPSSIKHIGNNAFPACTLPTLLNLTNIKYLGSNSFSYSDGVERVVIPESVDTIGGAVFSNCKDLKYVEFNAKNFKTVPYYKDGDYFDSPYIFAYCDSLKTVTIGANVTNIPRTMFADCRNLESVEFLTDNTHSSSPLTIHDYTFCWCSKLTSLILPERVDSIGGYFITGTDITTFSVPASCKYLGKYVFDNWTPLESLYFNSEVPPTFGGPISDRSWEYAKELTIYVPKRAYELYKNESDLSRYKLTWIPIKAESITLSHDSWTAQVGERLELTATVLPDDATNKILSWSSSDKNVAYVDRQGHVRAISVGDAVITATCDDVSATCNVTVLPTFAESITLSLNSWTAHAGETVQLTANILPENTTDKTVVWYSSDESVATVDADGKVTAVAIGEAIISATCGDVSTTCTVTVLPIIAESITLSHNSWTAHAGETVQITATILPENTTDKTVVWYSNDESVATVDTDGKVTAVAIGEAIISATCGDVSATCTVTVLPIIAESITLSHNSWTAHAGETAQITATILPENTTDKTVVWSSSDESVATVDADGRVTAVAIGEAIISASCGDVYASCTVTVLPTFAESITLSLNSWTAHAGETAQITATILPENTTDKTVVWSSSDESVATVDADGILTAVAIGEAIIYATCVDVSATCTVTVNPIFAESLIIEPKAWRGEEGSEFTIKAIILPENTTYKNLAFESSDTTIATVDNDGHVTVLKEGLCIISVSTTDGSNLEAECEITSLSGIELIFADPDSEVDVYDMSGIMLKHACTQEQIKHLSPGAYIIRSGTVVAKLIIR